MEENKPINNEEEVKTPNNEQQLNNSLTDEPIVPAGKTSDIINPTSDIKEMEVHQHTHPAHGKKNWKDYFWEFLMLFLAVFCGFLAEYQLEHVIENSREKQFIRSYIEDLKTDTAAINRNLVYQKSRKASYEKNISR